MAYDPTDDLNRIPAPGSSSESDADLAQIPAPTAAPEPPKQTFGDLGKRFAAGLADTFLTAPGAITESLGGSGIARRSGQELSKRITDTLSPQAQALDQNALFGEDWSVHPQWGQKIAAGVAQSAPSLIQAFALGRQLQVPLAQAGVAEKVAAGMGRIGVPAGAAKYVGQAVEALPFSAIEGAASGGQSAADVIRQVEEAPIEQLMTVPRFNELFAATNPALSPEERAAAVRAQMAVEAGRSVGAKTGLWTGAVGAVTEGGVLGPIARRLSGKGVGEGFFREAIKGGLHEAGQEAPQSAGEQYLSNVGRRDYVDPTQDPWQNVWQAGAEGGVIGFALGGGADAATYRPRPRDEQPHGAAPPGTAPVAPPGAPPVNPPVGPNAGPISRAVQVGQQSGAIPTNAIGGPVDTPGNEEVTQPPGSMSKSLLGVAPSEASSDEKTSALSAIADIAAKVPADAPLALDSPAAQAMAGAIERATAAGATQEDLLSAASGRVPPPDIRPSPKEVKAATKELDAAIDRVGKLTEKIARANAAADKARERGDEETAGNAESLAATLRDRLEAARGQLESLQGAQRAGTGSGPVPGTDVGTGVLPADGRPRGGGDQSGRTDAGGSVAAAGVPAGRPAGEGAGLATAAVPPADGGGARPVVLQNRDRSSAASVAQMASIAGNPDPRRLSFSRDFGTGAPVVFANADAAAIPETQLGAEGEVVDAAGKTIPVRYAVVEAAEVVASNRADGTPNDLYADADTPGLIRAVAGNGRMAGLQEAFNRGTAAGYVEGIAADARLHGVDPEVIRGMQNPVLVRVMRSDDVTPDIGDRSNVSGISQLDPVEQARTDVARVNLDGLEFGEDGGPAVEAVRRFIRAMPDSEQSGLMDQSGAPGRQAVDRLMAAAFAKAYESDDLVRLYAQATDPEARNVISALAQAAGPMARLAGAGDLDIRPAVIEAAQSAVNASRRGVSLSKFSQQRDFDVTPEAWRVVEHFVANARSAKRMAEGLRSLAEAAYAESQKGDTDMFGAVPKRTGSQIINEAFDGQQREGDANADAIAGRPRLDEEGTGREGGREGERAPASDQGQHQGEAGQDFGLVGQTTEEVAAQEAQRRKDEAERQQQAEEQARREAAPPPEDFTLTGSSRPVDEAAARGQMELGGEAPVNQQDGRGLTAADRYAKKVDSSAAELAGQFIEETKDGDYDGLMAAVERWAKDAEIAADDLRAATLKALDKMDVPAKQRNAIKLALNPARMAAKAEKASQESARVTRDSALADGTTVYDGKGNAYRVHYQRNNLVVAHPVIDGKTQVSADTSVRFWVNPDRPASGENDRTDPIYAAPQGVPAQKKPEGKQDAASIARDIAKARPFDDVMQVRAAAREAIREQLGQKALDDMGQGSMMTSDELTQAVHDGQYEGIAAIGRSMPVPVTESQIGAELSDRAFAGTSHSPEQRGRSARREYVMRMVEAWLDAKQVAGDDAEALARITDEFEKLRDGYLSRYRAYLGAHSNVQSAMIAGPARFPVERNRKRSEAADKRAEDANDFLRKGIERLKKAARAPIDHSPTSEVERIRKNLAERERAQEQMKAVNAALRKGDDAALREMGFSDEAIAGLKKPDFAGRIGFPPYRLTNNQSEIRRLRERLEQAEGRVEAAAQGPTSEVVGGVRIEEDAQANRIRLIFEGKPDEAARAALKAAGFRWAPSVGAWQRQLTGNARAAARSILGRLTASEPAAQYRADEQQGITAQEGGYETDLFGDPLPQAPRGHRRARSAVPGVPGNVQPAAAVQDTQAPAGDYLARTVVGSEARRTLGASVIRDASDAARATRYLYRNAVERFDGIVTDDKGKVLAVVGGFKGALTQSAVYPSTLIGEAVRIPGAARVWFSHNHPSGTAELSAADRHLHGALNAVFRGSGIEPMGLLAVAGDKYAYQGVTPDGHPDQESRNLPMSSATENVEVPVIERMLAPANVTGPAINAPAEARRVGAIYYGRAKEPGLVLLDAQHRVVAWVPLAKSMLGKLRGTGGMRALYRAVSESPAAAVVVVHGGELDALPDVSHVPPIENIGAALRAVDVVPLDAINVVADTSRAEAGQSLASGPVFSRGTGTGMATAEVTRIADAVRKAWANGPEVVVVQDMQDMRIPEAVRREDARQRSGGASGEPEGFFHGGKVYLVAGQLGSPADVVRVLAHEALGHYGLRGLYGERLGKILDQIANVRRAEVTRKAQEYGLDARTVEGRRAATEEILAEMAQKNPQMGFVKKAIAAIRQWLRELGFRFSVTDADIIAQFILPARAFVERGARGATDGVAFSRRPDVTPLGFYSELARKVEAGPGRADAANWKGFLRSQKGIKPDEIEWSGIEEFLDIAGASPFAPDRNSVPLKDFADAAPLYAELLSDLLARPPGGVEVARQIKIPSATTAPVDPVLVKHVTANPELRSDLRKIASGNVHTLGDLGVPAQRLVVDAVRAAIHDRKVREAVVELFPVDVVNDLIGSQGTSERLLNDVSVLENFLSIDRDSAIPGAVDVAVSSLVGGAALDVAEMVRVGVEAGRRLGANRSAVGADEGRHVGRDGLLIPHQSITRKVTKEAVLEYLAGNGVKVEEVVLGDPETEDVLLEREARRLLREDGIENPTDEQVAEFIEEHGYDIENARDWQRLGATKFGNYRVPGSAENYRELLLTLPVQPPFTQAALNARKAVFDRYAERIEAARRNVDALQARGGAWQDALEEMRALEGERDTEAERVGPETGGEGKAFRSGHWDQPNVLAHIRFDERTDADGKRVLFINEIQSDWAQVARKTGFKSKGKIEVRRAENFGADDRDRYSVLVDGRIVGSVRAQTEAEALEIARARPDLRPPLAPFVGKTEAWVALALKRMIRYAAENGFDRVAIASGEQAAEMFGLDKHISRLYYSKEKDGYILSADGHNGEVFDKHRYTESELEGVVGKEIAQKIIDGAGKRDQDGDGMVLEGVDLKVEAKGMRGFYDKIVPTVLKEVLKKVGGRLATVTLPGTESRDALAAKVYGAGETYRNLPSESKRRIDAMFDDRKHEQLGFDITPAMRDTVLDQGMPLFSRRPTVESVQAAAGQAAQAIRGATLKGTWKSVVNAWTDKKPLALQLLGRRQIVDVYGNLLPHLGRYSDEMQQYDADKNESAALADELVNRWRKLADADALADLMHDATLAQFDPDIEQAGDADQQALKDRFDGLSAEAKSVYREARGAYAAHWNKVKAAIRARIERADLGENERRMMMEQFRDQFLQPIQGVYFPLARWGDYVITAKDADGQRVVVFAESLTEAQAEHARMERELTDVSKITLRREYNAARDAVSKEFVRKLFETVDETSADMAEADLLKDAINQLYLTSLPDVSWAKHGIHRKGTPGYSRDARRAFAMNMFHGGYYLSKLRHADVLQDYLRAMQEHIEAQREDAGYDSITAQQVVNEMVKRHDLVMNPDNSVIANTLTGMGFVWFLGLSPASAIVNLSQTALVAYPIMAARFGYGKAADALTRASKEAVQFRNDLRGRYGAEENAAIDRAVREGLIDITQAHDLAGVSEGRDNQLLGALSPVMRAASYLFHQAEKFNRQATFIAVYRLARQAGEGAEQAYETARDLTYKGHFDYASSNRARVMMGPAARVLLLFKQYGQNMIYTLGRNALLWAKGDREAKRALSGILVAHGLTAGMLGLPLAPVLLGLASIIGGSDDEPWDAEVALRNYLADSFLGKTGGEMLARGVFRGFFPGDISGRVGLDSLLIRDIDLTLEPNQVWREILEAALGPVIGIGVNASRGAADLARGDLMLGIQGMLPKAIADGVKTIRYATEGVKDRTGIEVLDEVTARDLVAQTLGFSPGRVREAYDARRAVYGQKRKLDDRRDELLSAFSKSVIAQDHETRLKTLQEIQHFNQINPTMAITSQSMLHSIQNRMRRQAQAKDGIYLPRKQRDLAELGRFANTR